MYRAQSPARTESRMECPGTPKKPCRLESAECQTPHIRAKELPAISDVSTACPSSGGYRDLNSGHGLFRQSADLGSIQDATIDPSNPAADFEAFKAFFSSGLADEAMGDWEAPSSFRGGAPGPSASTWALDTCLHTPCGAGSGVSDTKVPTVPHLHAVPRLLRALQQKNIDALMAALTEDPDSATIPFVERDMEPPVCAAVRLRCPAAMVAALLDRGADPGADDMWGNTAMKYLQQSSCLMASSADYVAEVQELLLRHGAKHDVNFEPSVDEFMWEGIFAQWPPGDASDDNHDDSAMSEVSTACPSADEFMWEGTFAQWPPGEGSHLQWSHEQVADLIELESMLSSEPAGGRHDVRAGVISI